MKPLETLALDAMDLSTPDFWTLPIAEREGAFQRLRREDPIRHFKEIDYIPGLPVGEGFYAITRHADILEMSRQPEIFCSSRGATSINDLPTEMLEFYGSMINMDDPRHARLRGIVSRSFTPRVMQNLMDDVQRVAVEVIERIRPMGGCDFVTEVSQPMPLKIICDMMGIPESQYGFVLAKSNIILSSGDPEYIPEGSDLIAAFMTAGAELAAMMSELGAHKRQHPGDDLTSALVTAEVDGEHLSDQELASFFILLLAAGNETTRTAISQGLIALCDHPAQRAAWGAEFEALAPTAVEEIVRWATPVVFMRRTATRDVTVGGHDFKAGDKVILFYNSANRDERVFPDPYRFDLRRDPNFHVGFGGPGPHFCLGAHLARREITVMFRELFQRVPDIHVSGEPEPPALRLHQRHQASRRRVHGSGTELASAYRKRAASRSARSRGPGSVEGHLLPGYAAPDDTVRLAAPSESRRCPGSGRGCARGDGSHRQRRVHRAEWPSLRQLLRRRGVVLRRVSRQLRNRAESARPRDYRSAARRRWRRHQVAPGSASAAVDGRRNRRAPPKSRG